MNLRPDFERTATGYAWLDWLTAPYWRWADWRSRRALYRLLGRGDLAAGEAFLRSLKEEQ